MGKEDNSSNSSETKVIIKESGRSLPTTNTTTPMPETKPPASNNTSTNTNADKKN